MLASYKRLGCARLEAFPLPRGSPNLLRGRRLCEGQGVAQAIVGTATASGGGTEEERIKASDAGFVVPGLL